jgi:hypothetical protein
MIDWQTTGWALLTKFDVLYEPTIISGVVSDMIDVNVAVKLLYEATIRRFFFVDLLWMWCGCVVDVLWICCWSGVDVLLMMWEQVDVWWDLMDVTWSCKKRKKRGRRVREYENL